MMLVFPNRVSPGLGHAFVRKILWDNPAQFYGIR